MQNDYYILAHEQASKERGEIRTQIESLLARDEKLKKLVECLNEFLPASENVAHEQPHAAEQHAAEHEHAHA